MLVEPVSQPTSSVICFPKIWLATVLYNLAMMNHHYLQTWEHLEELSCQTLVQRIRLSGSGKSSGFGMRLWIHCVTILHLLFSMSLDMYMAQVQLTLASPLEGILQGWLC